MHENRWRTKIYFPRSFIAPARPDSWMIPLGERRAASFELRITKPRNSNRLITALLLVKFSLDSNHTHFRVEAWQESKVIRL